MSSTKCLVILQICAFIRLSSQDQFVGDSFPTCVEVFDVQPPPGSMLNVTKATFTVTFTRYVSFIPRPFMSGFKSALLPLRFPPVFLTGTLTHYDSINGAFEFRTSETNRMSVTFHIQEELDRLIKHRSQPVRRSANVVHLVVGGGLFGFQDTFYDNTIYRMVPMTVIGKYYLNDIEKPKDAAPTPVVPSLYCRPRLRRPLPTPYYENEVDIFSFDIMIPSVGHVVEIRNNGRFVVNLALAMKGRGNGSIALPTTIMAELNGVNVTVALPERRIFCQKKDLYYKIPVRSEIVHEVIERIYNRIHYRHTYFSRKGFTKPPADIVGFNTVHKNKFWTAEFYVVGTKKSLFSPYSMKRSRQSIKRTEYFGEYSLAAEVLHPEQDKDSFENYDRNKYNFGHLLGDNVYSGTQSKVYKECPSDSPRTRRSGRQGHTYHVMEYGPLYRLVIPDEDADNWKVRTETKVEIHESNVRHVDITNQLTFNGDSSTIIPSSLYQAVMKYAILLQAKSELSGPVQTILDEGIFVPRKEGLSQSCGGIQLFKNITSITKDERFCEKPFGDCVGHPFTTLERYPVIPPFGLPELAGVTTDLSKMPRHELLHGGTNRFSVDRVLPRSVYLASKEKGRWLYLAAPDTSTTDVQGITFEDVRVLDPDLGLDANESCSKIVSFQSLFHDKTTQNQAILTVSLHNQGLGGANVTVFVNCTRYLILIPQAPQLQRWVQPNERITLTMELNGIQVVQIRRRTHRCTVSIDMLEPPGINRTGQSLECPMRLITHYGAFEDPCTTNLIVPLPRIKLDYYIFPESQMQETRVNIDRLLRSFAGNHLTFVKAVTLIVTIPSHHEKLLSNLHELRISCKNNTNNTLVLTENQLQEQANLQAVRGDTEMPLSKSSIHILSEFTMRRRLIFFMDRRWFNKLNSMNLTSAKYASRCGIEVLAGRPHPLCDQHEVITQLLVPLVEADITAALMTDEETSLLSYVYGDLTDEMFMVMHYLIISGAVLLVLAFIGHGILYAISDDLPSRDKVFKMKQKLKKAKTNDVKKWENPQMYLTKGKHGPYYRLHDFKATDALDTKKLSSIKLAGVLKYKEKELQVLFGHVKQVFVSTKEKNTDIWLQASSGMYKLQYKDVHEEYKGPLKSLLRRHGVKVKD